MSKTEQLPASKFTEKMRQAHKEVYLHRPCQYTTDIYNLCGRLDRSEARLKDLLDACRELVKFCYPDGKWRGWDNMKGILEIIQPVRRLAEKERKL